MDLRLTSGLETLRPLFSLVEKTPLPSAGWNVYASMVWRQSLGGRGGPQFEDQRVVDITCGLLGPTMSQTAQGAKHTYADRMPKIDSRVSLCLSLIHISEPTRP